MYRDSLGDRMKMYEKKSEAQLLPLLPVIARLDGKAFHSFTKGLEKPFDDNLINLMKETTRYLVSETNAVIGYTQSDEITLIYHSDNIKSQIFMDGKTSKMISILSSMATLFFNKSLPNYLPDKVGKMPLFDCRVFNVPTKEEAINNLVWREQDATRNSISMLAQHHFSHKTLHKKSCSDMQDMLFNEHGINWNNLPFYQKRGIYITRSKKCIKFSPEELNKLPEKHEARKNPDLKISRSVIGVINLPILTTIENIKDVVFNGADPILKKEID